MKIQLLTWTGPVFAARRSAVVLALILAGVWAGAAQADEVEGQRIYIQNNTSNPIWVATRYKPPGGTKFVSAGFWRVDPGQRKFIVYNANQWMYFYARDDRGNVWDGSATSGTVQGETLNMFKADTTSSWEPWVLTFYLN